MNLGKRITLFFAGVAMLVVLIAAMGFVVPAVPAESEIDIPLPDFPAIAEIVAAEQTVPLEQVAQASVLEQKQPKEELFVAASFIPACQEEAQAAMSEAELRAAQFVCAQPQAIWVGEWAPWDTGLNSTLTSLLEEAVSQNQIPVFVLYNVPGRDCGLYAAHDNEVTGEGYLAWIRQVADALGEHKAIVILEPDALAQIDSDPNCMDEPDWALNRLKLISSAAEILSAQGGVSLYIDAGNPAWVPAETMAGLLKEAGVQYADGFSLNVSNRHTTAASIAYGEQISSLVGGKRFVIDTSRNGNGVVSVTGEAAWCNPANEALGNLPALVTGKGHLDAYLWVKAPGESDGECTESPLAQQGPEAGTLWPEKLLSLFEQSLFAELPQ